MTDVRIRVPNALKAKMDEHSEINWSALLRSRIEEEIAQLESRNLGHAVAVSEQLSNNIDEESVQNQNTAETVREWRDEHDKSNSD